MVKIVHCADLHLDSPFALEDVNKAAVRRAELRGTFTSMMFYVRNNDIDLMLIAGDLFDREFVTRETVDLVVREFANTPNCRIVISPGNHDPFTQGSVYAKTSFPDNVYIFDRENLSCFSFDDIGVDIYGYAFTSPSLDHCPFTALSPRDPGRINLLCAHGDMLSPISASCPISVGDLKDSGFDYAALGHIHNSPGVEKAGTTYYAYSGCLEGRDFGETGKKGFIYAELEKEHGIFNIYTKMQYISKRRYETENVNISGISAAEDAADAIRRRIVEKGYGEDTALKVTLCGDLSPEFSLPKNLADMCGEKVYSLEIKDRTLPLYDYQYLKNDPSVRGALFAELLPMLTEGTANERELAAKALRYGLAALSGSDLNF